MGRTESDTRRRRKTRNDNGGRAVGRLGQVQRGGINSIAELAYAIGAPALHLAVRQQGTRVGATQSDTGRRRDARDLHGGEAVSGSPVPELAVVVVAPALHRAVRQHSTRVGATQSDARPLHAKRK